MKTFRQKKNKIWYQDHQLINQHQYYFFYFGSCDSSIVQSEKNETRLAVQVYRTARELLSND